MSNIEYILQVCESYFKTDFKQKKRTNKLVYGRAIYYKLAKELTISTLQEIGGLVNKDHACVINAVNKFDNTYINETHPFSVFQTYNLLKELIMNEDKFIDHNNNLDALIILKKQLIELKIELQKKKDEFDKEKQITSNVFQGFTEGQKRYFIKNRLEPFKRLNKIK